MKTFLKPLAAAALLAVGAAAHADLYDWSYNASFDYTTNGLTSTPTTVTLTGQLNGTATTNLGQAGVDFGSFVSLSLTDSLGHTVNLLDRGALQDYGSGSDFLATDNKLYTKFFTDEGGGLNGIEAMTNGVINLFYTASGSNNTQNWIGDLSTGTWSLALHTTGSPSAVPEPATALLALLGVPAVAWRSRRRAAAKAAA